MAIAELADALRPAGVSTTRVGVVAAARAWLAAQPTGDDPGRLADVERRLSMLAVERTEVEAALAEAMDAVETAATAAGAAARTVAGLEAELRARAGDDSRLVERALAARALRDQVEAVEAQLAEAGRDAADAVTAAEAALAAADAERDRIDRDLGDLARQANRTAADLPAARRPAFDLVTGLVPLAGALRAEAATLADLLVDADAVLAAAEAAAGRGPDHPTAHDVVAGAGTVVRSVAPGAAILAEPFEDVDPDAVDGALAAIVEASACVPTVVVTTDITVVGWGIGLPGDVGSLVPARSLEAILAAPASAHPAVD
jgi:hypothetical protein